MNESFVSGLREASGSFSGFLDVEAVAELVGPSHQITIWDSLGKWDVIGWAKVAWAKIRRKRDPRILYTGMVVMRDAQQHDDGTVTVSWTEGVR